MSAGHGGRRQRAVSANPTQSSASTKQIFAGKPNVRYHGTQVIHINQASKLSTAALPKPATATQSTVPGQPPTRATKVATTATRQPSKATPTRLLYADLSWGPGPSSTMSRTNQPPSSRPATSTPRPALTQTTFRHHPGPVTIV